MSGGITEASPMAPTTTPNQPKARENPPTRRSAMLTSSTHRPPRISPSAQLRPSETGSIACHMDTAWFGSVG